MGVKPDKIKLRHYRVLAAQDATPSLSRIKRRAGRISISLPAAELTQSTNPGPARRTRRGDVRPRGRQARAGQIGSVDNASCEADFQRSYRRGVR